MYTCVCRKCGEGVEGLGKGDQSQLSIRILWVEKKTGVKKKKRNWLILLLFFFDAAFQKT